MRPIGPLAALTLFACGGDKPDESVPTGSTPTAATGSGTGTGAATGTGTGAATGTGTGTGTGGATTPVETDCANGADDDTDGLLDCEDPDCAMDAACFESLCADGLDNDGDGLQDCTDEDCWGNGCEVTMASLTGPPSVRYERIYHSTSLFGGPGCNGSVWGTDLVMALDSPVGTVRFMPASTPVWTTCTWSAATSWVSGSSSYAAFFPNPVQRNGFAISAGCPLQTSGFLPAWWTLEYNSNTSSFPIRTRPAANGTPWFVLNASVAQYFGSSSTFVSPTSSGCSAWHSIETSGADFAVAPGGPYTNSNP